MSGEPTTDIWTNVLLTKLEERNNNEGVPLVNMEDVRRAIFYCKKYHADQKRDSGEPYYSHPIIVARIVSNYCFNTEAVITSLLHDIIEDTLVTKEMISGWFGTVIANNVDLLTRAKKGDKKVNTRELLAKLYAQDNDDLLLIKFCDRLHNMSTISAKTVGTQLRLAEETLLLFLPLISYFGYMNLEQQLVGLCSNVIKAHENLNSSLGFSSSRDPCLLVS